MVKLLAPVAGSEAVTFPPSEVIAAEMCRSAPLDTSPTEKGEKETEFKLT